MKLAINYSPAARNLVSSGQINIDFFKTPNWPWMIEEAKQLRPVAVHFTLEVGNGNLDQLDFNEIERIWKSTGTPYINLHLDSRQKYFPLMAVDTTKKSDSKRIFNTILADINIVTNHFTPESIILENSPYRAENGNTLRPCVEPKMIYRIIEETGCGLLLDIPHAIISSKYMGIDTLEYFSLLPVMKIKELHFAGIHKRRGLLIDHLSIRKKDWSWLDWVLERVKSGEWGQPWLLAFEYGGVGRVFDWRCDPDVICKQVPLLNERVKRFNQNSP